MKTITLVADRDLFINIFLETKEIFYGGNFMYNIVYIDEN